MKYLKKFESFDFDDDGEEEEEDDSFNIRISEFIKNHGLNDTRMRYVLNKLGYTFDEDEDFSEMAINEGFTWLEKYNVWISTDTEYANFDIEVYEFLINDKF